MYDEDDDDPLGMRKVIDTSTFTRSGLMTFEAMRPILLKTRRKPSENVKIWVDKGIYGRFSHIPSNRDIKLRSSADENILYAPNGLEPIVINDDKLWAKFAIHEPDIEVVSFLCMTYGFLFRDEDTNFADEFELPLVGESYSDWKRELSNLYVMKMIYMGLIDNDLSRAISIMSLMKANRSKPITLSSYLYNELHYYLLHDGPMDVESAEKFWYALSDQERIEAAKSFWRSIKKTVDDRIKHFSARANLNVNSNALIVSYHPRNLHCFIWMQFAHFVGKRTLFNICEQCGEHFLNIGRYKHTKAKFCGGACKSRSSRSRRGAF
jgi:hypothetical protein